MAMADKDDSCAMDMNSPVGKKILALVRRADDERAGEQESADIVFKNISKNTCRLLLAVDYGRGGPAQYFQRGVWGKVFDNEYMPGREF